MAISAIEPGRRETRRRETERRIHRCAIVLTDERGLDGWTLEDLAEAADVSRRTLFNYFPGKTDAVLGGPPELPADALAAFDAGGPTGGLVDDLAALATAVLDEKDFDPEIAVRARRVVHDTPRLLTLVHERFEQAMREVVDHILRREGADFGRQRARLLVHLLVALFDDAVHQSLDGAADVSIVDQFDLNIRHARDLLA